MSIKLIIPARTESTTLRNIDPFLLTTMGPGPRKRPLSVITLTLVTPSSLVTVVSLRLSSPTQGPREVSLRTNLTFINFMTLISQGDGLVLSRLEGPRGPDLWAERCTTHGSMPGYCTFNTVLMRGEACLRRVTTYKHREAGRPVCAELSLSPKGISPVCAEVSLFPKGVPQGSANTRVYTSGWC